LWAEKDSKYETPDAFASGVLFVYFHQEWKFQIRVIPKDWCHSEPGALWAVGILSGERNAAKDSSTSKFVETNFSARNDTL